MKSLITLSILSAMLTACGSSNNSGAGVNSDGRCDSGLISANNSLGTHAKYARTMQDYLNLDQECQSFSTTYPSSSCRALDLNSGKEITVNTADTRASCKTLHEKLTAVVPAPTAAPTATPTAAPTNPVVITPSAAFCSDTFIASYNQLGADAKDIQAAGSNASLTITAARKMNQDCKLFIVAYPATVCTATNVSNNTTRIVDSSSVQPTCKKIDDLLKSIDGGGTSMMMTLPLLDSAVETN